VIPSHDFDEVTSVYNANHPDSGQNLVSPSNSIGAVVFEAQDEIDVWDTTVDNATSMPSNRFIGYKVYARSGAGIRSITLYACGRAYYGCKPEVDSNSLDCAIALHDCDGTARVSFEIAALAVSRSGLSRWALGRKITLLPPVFTEPYSDVLPDRPSAVVTGARSPRQIDKVTTDGLQPGKIETWTTRDDSKRMTTIFVRGYDPDGVSWIELSAPGMAVHFCDRTTYCTMDIPFEKNASWYNVMVWDSYANHISEQHGLPTLPR
jgi:hypothetical protein